MSQAVYDNAAHGAATPRLSILTPFLRDDPADLLAALEAIPHQGAEIVLLDDGTGDVALTARLQAQITALDLPTRLITLDSNVGRAQGRNLLTAHARADYLLFLDADMRPDSHGFLVRWLELIAAERPAVAFGGFSLDQAPLRREHAVHRALALRSDCIPVEQRRQAPEKYVFTSNLLVRRDVFDTEAFDGGFAGWGWEDVEWAMRVARRWPIVHIDNTATHMGLDPARVIAAKYEQSAGNFARVVAAHREVVSAYPSYRVAKLLRRAPARGLWRPILKALGTSPVGPVKARAFALRLYRAALYAEAV